MPEFTLTATSALGGFSHDTDDISVCEVTRRAIVSIAQNKSGFDALSDAFKAALGTPLPAPGNTAMAPTRNTTLFSSALDQWFAIFDEDNMPATVFITPIVGENAAITDQSDSWVHLRISGPKARDALVRICPINLHAGAFPQGSVARTAMEHIGTIISNPGDQDIFELMAPRSSANSFLHAVMISVQNIG